MKKTLLTVKKEDKSSQLAKVVAKAAETESIGTAMMQAGQEMMLAVEEVLLRKFNFTENELKEFHNQLEHILKVTHEAEGMGLNAVGIRTIRAVADIAEYRAKRELRSKSGILLPKPSKEQIIKKLLEN